MYGQKVTFTAQVTTSGPVPPTGTVVFMWKYFTTTYTIGTATLNSAGVATLTKSNLNADPFPMIAVYRGDTNNLSSTSPVLNQTVLQTTSAAALTSSVNPSAGGQAITFAAKITSPTVIPSGPVTFKAGTTVLGTAQLSSGKATFTTSTLPAGSTLIKVTYNGNSNIRGSSASVTQTVQP
ncbi:MAG: Ig-like domain-containing protein [Candidatus Sulfotelmatobacter sp.]